MDEPGGPLAGLDDAELLLLSGRRADAFGVFYERHAAAVLRFFVRRTLDADTAAELTAETFAEAFASRRSFRDLGSGGAGWLFGIARHELGRYARRGAVDARARRRLGLPRRELTDEDQERVEEMIDFAAARRAVAAAMDDLTDAERDAVTLRVMDERPYPEIARLLGCSEESARARVSRGLRRMASLLQPGSEELGVGGEAR